jgi:hypothetical protein
VSAITTLSAARRAGTRRPRGGVAAVMLSGLGTAISGLALVTLIAYWTPLMTYGNCLDGAGTVTLQNACQQQFDKTVDGNFRIFGQR